MKINKIIRALSLIILLLFFANIVAGCQNTTNHHPRRHEAKGCKNVAIILPEKETGRYEKYDVPMLNEEIKKAIPGVKIQDDFNAKNISRLQKSQAETALNNGACILVIGPVDGKEASEIVQTAKEKQVPVVAYDRLIEDKDTAFYVSFDGEKVGKIQGEYIVEQYQQGGYRLKKGAKLVMINGGGFNDYNARLFYQGIYKTVKPLIDSGDLLRVFDEYTPYWDSGIAADNMKKWLNQYNNDIQIAYVANDNMANGVIEVLRDRNLNGQVLVTGQDAELFALRNILKGDQAMTVYKPIRKEAQKTAEVVAALSKGRDLKEISNGTTKIATGEEIPSFLLEDAIAIDKSNISIVIKDGFVTKAELCEGITGGICE